MRVVIVNVVGSTRSESEREAYDSFVESMADVLSTFESVLLSGFLSARKLAEVKVVTSLKEAEVEVKEGRADLLIFVTIGLCYEAERIKKEHPELKVVVLTASLPKDQVIYVDKEWVDGDFLATLL